MGALDGLKYSNSHYFNKAMGWKGLLIEADPVNYKQLVMNRQNELVPPIHAAVCDEEREVHWVQGQGAVGGIVEFAPKRFQDYFWGKWKILGAEVVKCLPLSRIVQNATGDREAFFDFFSLDVEGMTYHHVFGILILSCILSNNNIINF